MWGRTGGLAPAFAHAGPASPLAEPSTPGKGVVTTPAPGPRVGDPAPAFSLRRTFDEDVSLAESLARGPVVLAFYVFDFGNY